MEEGDYMIYKKQMASESSTFQREMYTWMSNYDNKEKLNIEVQDPALTNKILNEIGYFKGKHLSISEVCEELGVDGMMTSFFGLEKPLTPSDEFIVQNISTQNNQASIHVELYDGFSKKVIWSFKNNLSGSNANNSGLLISSLMKNVCKKMPYYNNKREQTKGKEKLVESDK